MIQASILIRTIVVPFVILRLLSILMFLEIKQIDSKYLQKFSESSLKKNGNYTQMKLKKKSCIYSILRNS